MKPNWREERKLNAETFGVSAYSRNRGYYGYRGGRGRGGGRGYNRGGGMSLQNSITDSVECLEIGFQS